MSLYYLNHSFIVYKYKMIDYLYGFYKEKFQFEKKLNLNWMKTYIEGMIPKNI